MASDLEASRRRQKNKMERQRKLEELILTEEKVNLWYRLEDDDISVVARALARTTTLKVLILDSNAIGDAEVKLIADALRSNPNCKLQILYLLTTTLVRTEPSILPMRCIIPTASWKS